MNYHTRIMAPAIDACAWINCISPLTVEQLRGKVIVLHAFQMLCPGCVVHGLPQASSIHALYPSHEVQVIGLHSVFEHHDVMTLPALRAFVHEYQLRFPIAVDTPGVTTPEPNTMRHYQLKGTPSLVLIDKSGFIRVKHFGRLSDMQVGNLIGQLVQETAVDDTTHIDTDLRIHAREKTSSTEQNCDDDGCRLK